MSESWLRQRLTGPSGIAGINFTILKLTDNLDWAWWWVLLPFALSVLFWALAVMAQGAREAESAKREAEILNAVERGIKVGAKQLRP